MGVGVGGLKSIKFDFLLVDLTKVKFMSIETYYEVTTSQVPRPTRDGDNRDKRKGIVKSRRQVVFCPMRVTIRPSVALCCRLMNKCNWR